MNVIINIKEVINVAKEIVDTTGRLWVNVAGEEIYLPELINELELQLVRCPQFLN